MRRVDPGVANEMYMAFARYTLHCQGLKVQLIPMVIFHNHSSRDALALFPVEANVVSSITCIK